MLCKNCGREVTIAGKFCPFCGAPIEQTGANDETAVFTTLPDDLNGPIDTSAFDAAMRDAHPGVSGASDPLASTDPHIPTAQELPRMQSAAPRRMDNEAAPHTTRFDSRPPMNDRPYRRPSAGKKVGVIVLVIVLIAALIGGGVWFFLSRKPDENLTLAEKYMDRGDFDKALSYYEAAREDAKDPSAIDAAIQLLRDYQDAQDYVENGQYTEAIAALRQLQNRVTDPASALYDAIDDLIAKAQSAQSDSQFAADMEEAQSYLDDDKLDAAAGKLDSLAGDDSLTDEQKKQLAELQKKLEDARASQQRQQETPAAAGAAEGELQRRDHRAGGERPQHRRRRDAGGGAEPDRDLVRGVGHPARRYVRLPRDRPQRGSVRRGAGELPQLGQGARRGRGQRRRPVRGRDRRAARLCQLQAELHQGALLQAARHDRLKPNISKPSGADCHRRAFL